MTHPPVDCPSSTALWLAEALRDGIIMGALPPNEVIPRERVEETYRVEAGCVDEAFKLLAGKGWITANDQGEMVVSPMTAKEAVALFDTRVPLEIEAVRQSFPKLSHEQIAAADAAHLTLKAASEDDRPEAHIAFHLALYAAADPDLLREVEEKIRSVERYLCFERAILRSTKGECAEHLDLLHAARARDVDRAVRVIETHLNHGCELIAQQL